MIRRSFRVGLTLGLLAGLGFALAKVLGARSQSALDVAPSGGEPWPRLSTPDAAPVVEKAPAPAPAKKQAPARVWVEPKGGVCPTSHPVKAKLTSKIFHLPGMLNYDRTNPDRCYVDATNAEADGLRAAKR